MQSNLCNSIYHCGVQGYWKHLAGGADGKWQKGHSSDTESQAICDLSAISDCIIVGGERHCQKEVTPQIVKICLQVNAIPLPFSSIAPHSRNPTRQSKLVRDLQRFGYIIWLSLHNTHLLF